MCEHFYQTDLDSLMGDGHVTITTDFSKENLSRVRDVEFLRIPDADLTKYESASNSLVSGHMKIVRTEVLYQF